MQENPGIGVMLVLGGELPPLPLRDIKVRAKITGIIADVEVFQVFENPYDVAVECTYLFPLPHDAAVYDLEMKVGERVIRGEVYERKAARQRYEKAKAAGDGAALLEQERPNLFTTSVANLLPKSRVEVTIRFAGAVLCAQGRSTFTMPLTLTPRFCPPPKVIPEGDGFVQVGGVPDAERINPTALIGHGAEGGPRATLEVHLKTGLPLENFRSVLHEVMVERKAEDEILLRTGEVVPDRDFILQYDFGGQKIQSALFTYAPQKPSEKSPGTFLFFLVPPLMPKAEQIFPRELLFVIDRSGSMGGEPMEAARSALRYCLRGMRPGDTFNIVAFDDRIDILSLEPMPANQENILRADAFLETINARGGTYLDPALLAALQTRPDPARQRSVVLLTDGGVGNEDEIFRTVEEGLGDGRLYVFSIGMAPNHHLVEKLASLGRGFARHIPNGRVIEQEVVAFLQEVEKPLLVRPTISWPKHVCDVTPRPIPDLSADRPLVILGRYTRAGPVSLKVSGKRSDCLDARGGLFQKQLTLPEHDTLNPVLPQMWARSRVELLLDRERALGGSSPDLRAEVIELACRHRLMSPYTSFVAVEERSEEERAKAKDAVSIDIPSHAPAGTDMGATNESSVLFSPRELSYREKSGAAPGMAPSAPGAPAPSRASAPMPMAAPMQAAPMSYEPFPARRRSQAPLFFLLFLLAAGGALVGGPALDYWTWWKPLAWAGLLAGGAATLFGPGFLAYLIAFEGGWRNLWRELGSEVRREPIPVVIASLVIISLLSLLPLCGAQLDLWPLRESLLLWLPGLLALSLLGLGVMYPIRSLVRRRERARRKVEIARQLESLSSRVAKIQSALTSLPGEADTGPASGDLALKWLALHQSFDGSWGEEGPESLEALATGVLALLAHGSGPEGGGPYRPHCDRGAERLMSLILMGKLEGGRDAQAMALWAACEVWRSPRWEAAREPILSLLGGLAGDLAGCARAAAFHAGLLEKAPEQTPDLARLFSGSLTKARQIFRGYHAGMTFLRAEGEPERGPELSTARVALAAAFSSGKRNLLAQKQRRRAAA